MSGRKLNFYPSLRKSIFPAWQPSLWLLVAIFSSQSAQAQRIIDLDGTDGSSAYPDGTYVHPQCVADNNVPVGSRPNEGYWTAINLNQIMHDGKEYTCADGSDYKFFVKFHPGSSNLAVTFESGGACWDYETCTRNAGRLSANNYGPITESFMAIFDESNLSGGARYALSPHLGRIDNSVPTNKYNQVFFPYCTADVYAGNAEVTYRAQDGSDPQIMKHFGFRNVEAAMKWLGEEYFSAGNTGQLLVIGSSAGGVGATLNYPLVRDITQPKCSALVNDSGPIFPNTNIFYSDRKHRPQTATFHRVANAWKLTAENSSLAKLDDRLKSPKNKSLKNDLGWIMEALAKKYPNDRMLLTAFQEDMIFSSFSFAGGGLFKPGPDYANEILSQWKAELGSAANWMSQNTYFGQGFSSKNWGYYFPHFRHDFCSHTVTTTPIAYLATNATRAVGGNLPFSSFGTDSGTEEFLPTIVGGTDEQPDVQLFERRRFFNDALRQLLDKSQPIPRFATVNPHPDELTFMQDPGFVPFFSAYYLNTWFDFSNDVSQNTYQDKAEWIAKMKDSSDPEACAYIGNYQSDFIRTSSRYQIQNNELSDAYISINASGQVIAKAGNTSSPRSNWIFEKIGNRFRIKNASAANDYLYIQNDVIKSGPLNSEGLDSQWTLEYYTDFPIESEKFGKLFRIRNSENSDQYLKIVDGSLEIGPASRSMLSALWLIDSN